MKSRVWHGHRGTKSPHAAVQEYSALGLGIMNGLQWRIAWKGTWKTGDQREMRGFAFHAAGPFVWIVWGLGFRVAIMKKMEATRF